jgi:UDP-N-acetyl-D-glucosamine/UDP-N-acetyl-D-galactosamine dehydrogenase
VPEGATTKDGAMAHERELAVIGLGYVGLPVAVAFARSGVPVVGFDIDRVRIEELRAGIHRTREVDKSELAQPTLIYACDPQALAPADFYIITVPTPIDPSRRPDLTAIYGASETVGRFLKPGDIVVFESTVYPGAVEEDCAPILERTSGLRCGRDFTLGYSPERINPGDKEHALKPSRKLLPDRMRERCRLSPRSTARSSEPAYIARHRSKWRRRPKSSKTPNAISTLLS